MKIVLSNASSQPIYEQIKQQLKAAILSGELAADDMLPSLRQLARDLKISVLTTMRAYNELEQEGFVTSLQGKGYFVMPQGSQLMQEQLLREVEGHLDAALAAARRAGLDGDALLDLLRNLLEAE